MTNLEIPAPRHTTRLCIVDDGSLEEVSLISVWVLETVKMFIWIGYRFWIGRGYSEHRESLVREPLCVLLSHLAVYPHDLVSEDMLGPDHFLFYRCTSHLEDEALIIYIWKLSLDLADDIRK